MNLFRFGGDMAHLAAIVLLPFKLHASRSAAGVSLKTQELYLLVFLTRYLDLFFRVVSIYNSVMKITYVTLTAATIAMMKMRPSLRASYDSSLDSFRHWKYAVLPCLSVICLIEAVMCENYSWWSFSVLEAAWNFSQLLEPLAIAPQLLLFRRCTGAGRLAWVYVCLLAAYRGLYVLNWVWRSKTEPWFIHSPMVYCSAIVQAALYLMFVVDRVYRAPPHSPPDVEDVMGPESSARERLLSDRRGPAAGTLSDGSETKTMRADEARKLKEAAQETEQLQRPQPHISTAAGSRDTAAAAAAAAAAADVAGKTDDNVGSRVSIV